MLKSMLTQFFVALIACLAIAGNLGAQCNSPNFEIGRIEVYNFLTMQLRTIVICSNQTSAISVSLGAFENHVNIYTNSSATNLPRIQLRDGPSRDRKSVV